MVEIYRTDQQVLNTLTDIQDGCWINMVDPTSKELEQIAERFEIEPEDISSALDEEESSRISLEGLLQTGSGQKPWNRARKMDSRAQPSRFTVPLLSQTQQGK